MDGDHVVVLRTEGVLVSENNGRDGFHLRVGGRRPKIAACGVFGVDFIQRYYDGVRRVAVFVDESPEVAQGVGQGLLGHYETAGTPETVDFDGIDVRRGFVGGWVASDENAPLNLCKKLQIFLMQKDEGF